MSNLSERLRALMVDKARSYQRLLRDASHEVRSLTLNRPWSEVEPALRRQGRAHLSFVVSVFQMFWHFQH